MIIPKVARRKEGMLRDFFEFADARSAIRAFLESAELPAGKEVLLPAYIGWSPREGSGVLDPIESLGLPVGFYRIDASLRIDLADLEARLRGGRVGVFVVIHYFGYVDPGYQSAVELARRYGALVLEDEAHAMLTDWIAGVSGRLGDAAVFSLHKMLPIETGGMLVINDPGRRFAPAAESRIASSPWSFDLASMAGARRRNARLLYRLLAPLCGRIDPLWPEQPAIVPQTLPVRIQRASRDALYERMNAAGFGVVSLYHTMVEPLRQGSFPDSLALSRTIMNLPVHPEATEDALTRMVEELDHQESMLARDP